MTLDSLPLARWAAPGALAATLLLAAASALAQDEPAAPEGTDAAVPAETVEPAEATADPAAADAAAPTPDVIPVQTGEAEAAPEAVQLDAIEVTGSRIRRLDYETAQPIAVVTREDIERTGLTNIGDILQRIPAAGSALNRNFNNGGNGQTEIDLRNLGSNRLLVLVNGHRWVVGTSFANLSAVDLNTIPVSIIERIEVLKDGASAVYGSDAIAGVVNIITRKEATGVELNAQAQAFEDGEGLVHAYNASFGNVAGKTSIFANVNYVTQEALFAGDRDRSAVPKLGTGTSRGSIFIPKGAVIFVPNPSNASTLGESLCPTILGGSTGASQGLPEETGGGTVTVPGTGPGTPVPTGVQLCSMVLRDGQTITGIPADGETTATVAERYRFFGGLAGIGTGTGEDPDKYNYAPINYLLTPYEQSSLFTQINHQFLDNLSFNNQILYNVSKTERHLAETPLLFGQGLGIPPPYDATYIDATNIYNPFDQDIGRTADGLVGAGIIGRRFVESGPRFLGRDVRTFFIRSQFDGAFDLASNLFSWDLGYSHGQNDNSNVHRGDLDMVRVQKALGPSTNCPSAENPDCVPLNLFGGPGTITQQMRDYIEYEATSTARYVVQDAYANISTEFSFLSGLLPNDILSAPIGMALGVEYRDESFTESPDPYTVQGTSSTNLRDPTIGAYNAREAYMEFALPMLRDKPWAQELDLSIAGRYTEYNTFSPETTGKVAVRWKPLDDLLVRGSVSQAFRAPNLTELFLGAADGYPVVADPCVTSSATGSRPDGTDVDANCDAEGVPDDVGQANGQVLARTTGNRDLDPELADTLTAGFVYSPEKFSDLTVYVDYFDIQIEDFIGFLGPQYILDQCYTRPAGSPRPTLCDFVNREPVDPVTGGGSLQFIESTSFNFAKLKTAGIDIGFEYTLPLADWVPTLAALGTFKFSYDSQYLIRYDRFIPDAAGNDIATGIIPGDQGEAGNDIGDNPLPRYKANATLQWARDQWKANWTVRYIRGVTEACSDGLDPPLQTYGLCSNPDTAFLDPALTDDIDHSTNEYGETFYSNVQVNYAVPVWNADLTFGVNNVFNQQPPLSQAAFANSFPATLFEVPDSRQPYLRVKVTF